MERLIALLLALPAALDRASFVVCGSGALAVRGLRDVHDLDLLTTEAAFKQCQRGEISGFEVPSGDYNDAGEERLLTAYNPEGEIDLFRTTPKLDRTFDQQVASGVERYQIPGVGLVMFQPLRDVLAIKALCPSKPKHVEDMVTIATRIAAEETPPPPPFEVVTGHVEGASIHDDRANYGRALGIPEDEIAADAAARLDVPR